MVCMEPGTDTIKRAAKLVKARREQLGRSQDLADYGGPSRWVITELELKHRWPQRASTQMEIARALNWREDAFELLARGRNPVEDDGVGASELRNLVSSARMILEELERRLGESSSL